MQHMVPMHSASDGLQYRAMREAPRGMTWPVKEAATRATSAVGDAAPLVLIVEDCDFQRELLATVLRRRGMRVVEVASGEDAVRVLENMRVDLMLVDLVLPGKSGIELCEGLSSEIRESMHVILVSALGDTDNVVRGLAAGADDFVRKPFAVAELVGRLEAGLRSLQMRRELAARNARQGAAKITAAFAAIGDELAAATDFQRALMPPAYFHCNGFAMSAGFEPCTSLAGDLVGAYPIGVDKVALYAVDVAGHGVPAALLSTAIAQTLDPDRAPTSPYTTIGRDGETTVLPPSRIVARLNQQFLNWARSERYFTMALAIVDRPTNTAEICVAGHPPPALLRADGSVRLLGTGGPPVGLLNDSAFTSFTVSLERGDRLVLYSDAFTECRAKAEGCSISKLLVSMAHQSMEVFANTLLAEFRSAHGDAVLSDDASVIAVAI